MALPSVATREEWLVARRELLEKEKELTRQRDALSAMRRELPMVRVDKQYTFAAVDGAASLLDMFEDRRQLIVYHFMFAPDWFEGCGSCSAAADEISDGLLDHLNSRDTTLAFVSRAPLTKIEHYRARKGWVMPWYSSYGSEFNYDFHVTLDESIAPVEYNYRTPAEHARAGSAYYLTGRQPIEEHGHSVFLREGNTIYHTYSMYARATETLGGSYYYLDLTALGRQEEWEEPKGRAVEPRVASPDFAS
ncbi:MAG TPA: DUF899 domain-containing protein [Pseudonocardia sp.]|jgi:predicted dithiol-disulfide oxidoreductase (DUF899 family)|uniref:DUF899 domain-containing protein n=1 Tax=Pseudonocardia sp. TaxID=60912 RepID=UPI002F3F733D